MHIWRDFCIGNWNRVLYYHKTKIKIRRQGLYLLWKRLMVLKQNLLFFQGKWWRRSHIWQNQSSSPWVAILVATKSGFPRWIKEFQCSSMVRGFGKDSSTISWTDGIILGSCSSGGGIGNKSKKKSSLGGIAPSEGTNWISQDYWGRTSKKHWSKKSTNSSTTLS